jgi:hypothetical protein
MSVELFLITHQVDKKKLIHTCQMQIFFLQRLFYFTKDLLVNSSRYFISIKQYMTLSIARSWVRFFVFAVHFQHCDIVSVHHTRNQKKYWRAQIPTLQKEMRSLQTINQNNTSIHLFNTNILLCLTWMFMLRLVFFFHKMYCCI